MSCHFSLSAFLRGLACALVLGLLLGSCEKSADGPVHFPAPSYQSIIVNPNYTGAFVVPGNQAILLWGSDGRILRSKDGKAWRHVDMPATAALEHIASDPTGKVLIAVGAQGAILRSADEGRSWRRASTSSTLDLKTVVHHPGNKAWFAAGDSGALLTSRDQGQTWNDVYPTNALDGFDIMTLFFAPDGTLLLGGAQGLFGASDDGGTSWHLTQLQLDGPISRFHQFGDTLIAASAYGKFLVASGADADWQLLETDGQAFFNDATYDPRHDVIVMVSHNGKVLRSADKGISWQLLDAPYHGTANYLSRVVFDPAENLLRAFGHYGTHLVSLDGGVSWESQAAAPGVTFESVMPFGKAYVSYGRGGLLATSFNNGRQWQVHLPQLDIYLREVLVTGTGSWIAAGELGVILRSMDQGHSWQWIDVAYTDPMKPPTFRALRVAPDNALIAAGPTGTIVRSDDDGRHWSTVYYTAFEENEAFTDLVFDPCRQNFVAVEADGRHAVSKDSGKTWARSAALDGRKFWHGTALVRKEHCVIVLAGQGGVLIRSTDGGDIWESVESSTMADLFGSYADIVNGQLFLLGAEGTLLRSADLGKSWQPATTEINSDLRRMVADPRSGALLAYGGDGVILRSTNAGKHWHKVDSGILAELRDAAIESETGNLLIAGRDGRIIRSRDGGLTWETLPTHTPTHFRGMAVDKTSGAIIAVGERLATLHR